MTELSGADLFLQLEAFAAGEQALGLADLRATIEAMGVTLDAVQGGSAFAFDFDAGTNVSITGLRIPDQDVSVLLDAATLDDGFGSRTLFRDERGRPVAQWRPHGVGRQGATLVRNPSRWLREGVRLLAAAVRELSPTTPRR